MEDQDYAEHIFALIKHVKADVAVKKNLESHYTESVSAIDVLNDKIDQAVAGNQSKSALLFKVVAYELYRLKDDMIKAITES